LLCGSLPKRVAEITFVRARIADAHRDGKRFVVRSDELLTSFLELKGRFVSACWLNKFRETLRGRTS
jgi:hypothetical protein